MPINHPPATLLRRMASAIYDTLLLIALWMTGTFVLLLFNKGEAIASDSWWYPLYLLAITGGFYVWFWTHGGQTLGMRTWRLWAVNRQGEALTIGPATFRYLLAVLSWLSVIGLLWCMIDARGRTAHDIVSRTDIIHIPK